MRCNELQRYNCHSDLLIPSLWKWSLRLSGRTDDIYMTFQMTCSLWPACILTTPRIDCTNREMTAAIICLYCSTKGNELTYLTFKFKKTWEMFNNLNKTDVGTPINPRPPYIHKSQYDQPFREPITDLPTFENLFFFYVETVKSGAI